MIKRKAINDSRELQALQGLHANVSLLSQRQKSGPNCTHFSDFFFFKCHSAALRGCARFQAEVTASPPRGGLPRGTMHTTAILGLSSALVGPEASLLLVHPASSAFHNTHHTLPQGLFASSSLPARLSPPGVRNSAPSGELPVRFYRWAVR